MNPLTREWVAKAEGDFYTAEREMQVEQMPNYDAICFHSQQCVEKYLKARLVEAGMDFGKTHDLGIILDSAIACEPDWENLRSEIDSLAGLAVEVRYPGYRAEADDALEALEIARKVRRIVRQVLRADP
jgi:HEPN domain-containing protein